MTRVLMVRTKVAADGMSDVGSLATLQGGSGLRWWVTMLHRRMQWNKQKLKFIQTLPRFHDALFQPHFGSGTTYVASLWPCHNLPGSIHMSK